jgi:hypothetical protein
MPTLQVRDVPEAIYKALAETAKRERRSLTQQALIAMERGLSMEDYKLRRQTVLDEVRRQPIKLTLDPVALVREDRNR